MNVRLTFLSCLAGVVACAQVPRTVPAFPAPGSAFGTPPVTTTDPGPQGLKNFGQTNVFTGEPGPRFTNPALARITNGLTNGLMQLTNGVGSAPGQTNIGIGGFTNATPTTPNTTVPGNTLPTLPGTTPTAPGVPPANPGTTPALPGGVDNGTIQRIPDQVGNGVPGSTGTIPPGLNPGNTPSPQPPRIPQAPPAAAPRGR